MVIFNSYVKLPEGNPIFCLLKKTILGSCIKFGTKPQQLMKSDGSPGHSREASDFLLIKPSASSRTSYNHWNPLLSPLESCQNIKGRLLQLRQLSQVKKDGDKCGRVRIKWLCHNYAWPGTTNIILYYISLLYLYYIILYYIILYIIYYIE